MSKEVLERVSVKQVGLRVEHYLKLDSPRGRGMKVSPVVRLSDDRIVVLDVHTTHHIMN